MKDETERLRLDAEREQAATAQRAAAEAEEAERARLEAELETARLKLQVKTQRRSVVASSGRVSSAPRRVAREERAPSSCRNHPPHLSLIHI